MQWLEINPVPENPRNKEAKPIGHQEKYRLKYH